MSYFLFLYQSPFWSFCRVFDSISSNISQSIWSTRVVMCLYLEILTSIIRTGLPILVELIDLVNSVIIFLSQTTLLRWLTFLLGLQPLLLDLFLSSDAIICSTMAFSPLGNSDHVVVSICIGFPSYSQQDVTFHRIAYDYFRANWHGLSDYLRDVPWGISLKSVLLLLLVNFVSGFRLMYISFIESIRASLTHLHGFSCFCYCHSL